MKTIPLVIQRRDIVSAVSGQCHCACSDSIAANARWSSAICESELRMHPELLDVLLDETHRVVFVPLGRGRASSIAVLNSTAWDILSAFKRPNCWKTLFHLWCEQWDEPIINDILGRFADLGFLCDSKEPLTPIIERPHVLEAWLHVTDRCNLHCLYCFLPHHCVDMPPEIGFAAIDASFRSVLAHQYSRIKLKYAGGEALLRFPSVVKIHRYAQGLSEQHGVALDGVVLSNGTLLTTEIIEAMQALKLQLMISLDGLGEFHNRQRPYADGHGSFTDVARAVDLALGHGLIPDISVTVSGRSVEGLPELIEWMLNRDLPFNLNFYRENAFSGTYEDLKLEEGQITAGMCAAYKVIEAHLPRRSTLASLVDLANLSAPHLRTCGVGQNYLVFDHLGQVFKCQMQMKRPITSIETNDPLALVRTDVHGIQNLSVEEKETCRDCRWRYWCTGGCPLATHRTTGQYVTRSPNCSIYKTLFPEIIRLEGLRLLRWQG